MDDARFDALAKTFGSVHSRRSLARLLGGLSLGGLLSSVGREEAAAALLLGGARCTSKAQCKSGRCLNPDTCDCTKKSCRCTCACSTTNPQIRCKQPTDTCKKAVCRVTGRCATTPKCADTNPCTQDLCTNGTCSHPTDPLKEGASCGGDKTCQDGDCACAPGRADCDGDGSCEVDLTTDRANCGECGKVCELDNADALCENSSCIWDSCNVGFYDCDGDGNCESTQEC
jgi:hypothetical protein